MKALQALVRRVQGFGLKRSAAVYLVIVVGLVLASEFAIDQIVVQGGERPGFAVVNALAIAALVGVFVFFLFQGAVEDREQASVALANSEERFRSLTTLSADWFWETDAEYKISWIAGGQSMLKLFGSELAYGRRIWEIPGIDVPEAAVAKHLAILQAQQPFHEFELCRPGRAGATEYHRISGEPRFDRGGLFLGYRGVGRDVTEDKRVATALSSAKDRLELALHSGALAIWDTDLASGRIFLSEGWAQMLGESVGEQWLQVSNLAEYVHELDRDAVLQASRRAIKGDAPSFEAEIRVRAGSGGWKWVMASGRVVERDAAGWALRMAGTIVDIDGRKRAEHALRDAEARYRTLVDLSPDGVLLQSDGLIEYANRAAAHILRAPRQASLVGLESMSLVHADDYEPILERARYLRAGPGKSDFRELRMLRLDGGIVTVEGASVSYLERGRLVVQTVLRDITERVRVREELAEREQRFRDVVEAAGEYVWETDREFRYTWLSPRVEAILGHVQSDLIGRRPQDFMPLGEARAVEEQFMRASQLGVPFRDLVHRSITKSGRAIWQCVSGVPVFDPGGALKGFRGTGADITARRQAEERVQYLATRDALTGLPNRLLLADRAGQAILNAGRKQGSIAVLSIGLDRFHLVSDSLGHRVGDAVLRATAERFSNALRRDDTLARTGDEDFVLLWDGTKGVEDVALVAKKLLGCLDAPVVVDGRSLTVWATIGISVYPDDGVAFADLMKNADAARQSARQADGNAYRFFSRELNMRAVERLEMESALHRALARDEFLLRYQPVVRSVTSARPQLEGAEIMLFWNHPQKGLLAPDEFLPFAGQAGLRTTLDQRMIEQAFAQIASWDAQGKRPVNFALNISARHFSDGMPFFDSVHETLQSCGLDGARIALEVSESNLSGRERVGESLGALVQSGVSLTVDGFGAGQTSLAALRQLPIRKLKIDRGLVAGIAGDEASPVLMATTVAIARSLGLAVAAEGIESETQLARVCAAGCEEWQGGLYSEPLEAEAFSGLLTKAAHVASA